MPSEASEVPDIYALNVPGPPLSIGCVVAIALSARFSFLAHHI